MRVHRIFQTEQDFEQKVSIRFKKRMQKLYALYMKSGGKGCQGLDMMKAACVAWAFVCAVEEGQAQLAYRFDDMLHGEAAELIEFDDRLIVLGDDDYLQETFIWDSAFLLLEESGNDLESVQFGYDIIDRHVREAYNLECEKDVVAVESPKVAVESPKVAVEMPNVRGERYEMIVKYVDRAKTCNDEDRALRMELDMRHVLGASLTEEEDLMLKSISEFYVMQKKQKEKRMVEMLVSKMGGAGFKMCDQFIFDNNGNVNHD